MNIIEINGVKIETGHHYYEYTKEERALLPRVCPKAFWLLGDCGIWYFDDTDWDPPGFLEDWWVDGIIDGTLRDFDYVTKKFKGDL